MTDSRVGTYGSCVLSLYTLTKVHLLGALGESQWHFCGTAFLHSSPALLTVSKGAGPALIVTHCMARVAAPYLIRSFDYVDDEQGPKSSFYAFMIQAKHLVSLPRVLVAMTFGFSISLVLYGPVLAVALMILTLSIAQCAGNYGNAKLGGVMGDFLGATTCICELLILCLLLVVQQREQQPSTWITWIEYFGQCQSLLKSDAPIFMTVLNILDDGRLSVMIRCLVVYVIVKAWMGLVIYPNRKQTILPCAINNENATVDGPTNIPKSMDGTKPTPPVTEDVTPKNDATRILSLPTSTFRERYDAVQAYLDVLAKPVGSLGTLECWSAKLAALQRTLQPTAQNMVCLIFAGDHGAAAAPEDGGEGCSAYPQAVTGSVLVGLERGVAGASVLARVNNVSLHVIDVGVIHRKIGAHSEQLVDHGAACKTSFITSTSTRKLRHGTRNFCVEPAMSAEECQWCIQEGRDSLVKHVTETCATAIVLGEVGIGNTTSSSAIIAALTQQPVDDLCGGGAFATRDLSKDVISKKIDIVTRALIKHHYFDHRNKETSPIQAGDVLAKLGGGEIAAIVGALLEASDRNIAVLVDGFIATAAALVAVCLSPWVCHVLFFATQSAEPGQHAALAMIQGIAVENNIPMEKSPVLSMDLRMGEGTAALLAVPILRSAATILSDMATIQDILS
jgi:nicotinate-nucleotide--dimethylbenzimidazole phosphoribosyltransferase